MNNTMEYKGYTGTIEFSEEDQVFYGKVLGIQSLLLYEGKNRQELEKDFHEFIDEYLKDCGENGITPEKPFTTNGRVTITPELYEKASLLAASKQISLDQFVEQTIEDAIAAVG